MFGVKDLFTLINLIGGAVAICLCIDGEPYAAGIAVMLGYLLGDTMDGWVARKLGTANQFGAELDTISDHTSHVIAPAAIVYTVYKDVGLVPEPWAQVLAMALSASMIVAVSVRHARNIVAPVEFKGVWAGLPRSVFGFLAIGYCNSTLAPDLPGGWWIGVVMIPALGILTLTHLPFPSHRMGRAHFKVVTTFMIVMVLAALAISIARPAVFFDVLFAWMATYSVIAWMTLTPEERAAFREQVIAAKASGRS